MSWHRLRTGVAMTRDGKWWVIRNLDGEITMLDIAPFDTEAEAEACAADCIAKMKDHLDAEGLHWIPAADLN